VTASKIRIVRKISRIKIHRKNLTKDKKSLSKNPVSKSHSQGKKMQVKRAIKAPIRKMVKDKINKAQMPIEVSKRNNESEENNLTMNQAINPTIPMNKDKVIKGIKRSLIENHRILKVTSPSKQQAIRHPVNMSKLLHINSNLIRYILLIKTIPGQVTKRKQ